jgi:hypothetical protein
MEEHIEEFRLAACDVGDNDPGPPQLRVIDMRVQFDPGHPAYQAITSAMAAAWSLAAATRVPPGSVPTRPAWPGGTRLVRATGDGWTLIGRTDGPVLLLLDRYPGLPVDIDGTPRRPELLDALTAARSAAR